MRRADRRRRVALLTLASTLAALALLAWGLETSGPSGSPGRRTTPVARGPDPHAAPPRLAELRVGSLRAPVDDAAAAAVGPDQAMLLGGLTGADTSRSDIVIVKRNRDVPLGRLPGGVHDAAAVELDGAGYLFGGGNGVAQLDRILRVDPATGVVGAAGRLPAPSSDQAAAALGSTAYVVGGYTGSRWLDTIVAWQPGRPARVVAHLPTPLRYAAVASSAGRLIIAGGSTPDGAASDAVLAFDPRTARVTRLGRLPAPTTHAAAAAIGDEVYVIGGRGATVGTATDRIVAVNARTGRIASAGRLSVPRSDLAAVSLTGRILLAGGLAGGRAVATLSELSSAPAVNVYAADAAGS